MSSASPTAGHFGKRAQERSGERFPHIGETNLRVINSIKEMYADAAVVLGRWLNISDKTAKRKLKFERTLDVEELGILIRSERGFEIIAAIQSEDESKWPSWWRIVVPLKDAADARQIQIAARRRLKKTIESALDADQHLTRTIQAAEALSDQDHAGPYADALRSMAGIPNRSLAQKRGRK